MSALRDTFVIARREFLERVQSRWFVAMTLLGPIGMVAIVLIPALLAGRGPDDAKVEIVDQTGVVAAPLADALRDAKWKPTIVAADTPDAVEMARIRDHQINGFITVPRDALDHGEILYRGDNGSSQVVQVTLPILVTRVVQIQRGLRAKVPTDRLDQLLQRVQVTTQHTDGRSQAASGLGTFFIGYAVVFLLYMVITLYGVGVMRSVVQEKTSRVMELMVATVKPRSLMSGKILGVGSAGLVQVVVWLTMGALTLTYRDQLLHAFGARGGGGDALPALTLDTLVVIVAYFILGYFFYAALFAAAGAMVSSEQDTQQVQTPVSMLLAVGAVCLTAVSNDPRGTAAGVLTQLPFWSSMLMPMRYVLGGAGPVDVAISLAILTISTVLIARASAKIYRVGVLMYGKRPTARELLRWIRY